MQSKKDLWIKRIKDYKSSGLTAVNWCEENGINIHTLKYHITKINKEKKQQKANQTKWASVVPGQSR
ncbi:MAG: IS66 family insertion sequence element accessory protein TnpA [Candidatus Woesearchaeota archaeon]